MDVTTPTESPRSTAGTPPEPAPRRSALSSDFETFLLMLTTQMQNQDPLNPLESSEFAVQLATFSGVEQQVKTNDLLESLLSGLSSSGMAQMASWIGKEVRTDGPASFDGSPITLFPRHEASADRATLVVRNEAGVVVARNDLGPEREITWAGVGDDGVPLGSGLYSFEVESSSGGGAPTVAAVEHYASVAEVRTGTDGPRLVLAGGVEIDANAVLSVREAALP